MKIAVATKEIEKMQVSRMDGISSLKDKDWIKSHLFFTLTSHKDHCFLKKMQFSVFAEKIQKYWLIGWVSYLHSQIRIR